MGSYITPKQLSNPERKMDMGKEVYKIEVQLPDNRIVSSYVKDWERAVEILGEIKKRGHSQFFDNLVIAEATLYQSKDEREWLELERWRRPQPLTPYGSTGTNPLAIAEKSFSWLFSRSEEKPYQIFSGKQQR